MKVRARRELSVVRVAESEKVNFFAEIMYCKDHHLDNTTVVFQDILSERSKEPR